MIVDKKNNIKFYFLLFIFLLLFCFFIQPTKKIVCAKTLSDVIDDLRKDENFNIENFPLIDIDFSIKIIQIAETTNKELLIYTYQPAALVKDFLASSINISTTINENVSYKNYTLTLLNKNNVFYKYKVNDFTIKNDVIRYYNISSIYRPFDSAIDTPPEGDNTITELAFSVGKLYTACTINNDVTYTCLETETILITDKFVGFLRYSKGFHLAYYACDGHFVAFSTDKQIDKLKEADVFFITQGYYDVYQFNQLVQSTKYEQQEDSALLKYTDSTETVVDGLFGKTYSWNRIESVNDFMSVNKDDLNDEAKKNIENKQWILRFKETEYTDNVGEGARRYEHGTRVNDVTVLRLKFETNGVVYNLGVIDNKQTGSDKPVNEKGWSWMWLVYLILGFVLLIAIIIAFPQLLIGVVQLLFLLIKYLFIGIWKIISFPFKILNEK